MSTRRDFLRASLGTGTLLLLTACGIGSSTTPTAAPTATATQPAPAVGARPTGTPAAHLKGAKLHLLNWSSFIPEEDTWFKQTLVDEWAKPNGVDLTVELVGGNDVQPKITAALQAGAGPDLMQQQWTWAHLYADKLLDVSDVAEMAGTAGGGWYEVSKQNNLVDGRWRAVPWGMTGNAIAYRQHWLKDGANTDAFPTTWEDFTTVGGQVKQHTNTFVGQALGHSFGDPPTFVYPFLWSYGGSETDETGKKVVINSPETRAALTSFQAWFRGCSDPQCLSWDDSSNNRAYLASQIWATNNGVSIYVAAEKDAPDIAGDTQHVLLPKGPRGQFVLAYPLAFAIPTYVKDPQPAKELLAYMLDPKTYAGFMKAGKGYTLAPYTKGETSGMWPSPDPKFDPFKEFGRLSKWYGYPAAPSPAATEAGSKYIVVDMFAKVAQGTSPQEAMQWAEGELKQVYHA